MPGMLLNYPRNEAAEVFRVEAGLAKKSAPAERNGSTPRKGTADRRSDKKPNRALRPTVTAS